MTPRTRLALAFAALLLVLMYLFPIWKITLDAPQYPEGLGMYIWIDTVTGEKPQDLANINGLNHYIGMKTIEPDTIPELKLMPWLIGGLLVLGLGAAAGGKRWMLYTWVGLFLIAAVTGLVDFYLWEYDYGHDLDPTAAIKVPGMNYQPPLIGSKQLLNFVANSWPSWGGWAAFASLGIGFVLAVQSFLGNRKKQLTTQTSASARTAELALVGALMVGMIGCTPAPKPLVHGQDACAYCKMTLADEQYGAELVTNTGKTYAFDSIECLAAHQLEERVPPEDVHSLWVVDFQNPPHLLPVADATLLHSKDLSSPMGMYLTAFGPGITPQAVTHSFYGNLLTWDDVLDVVADKQPPPGAEGVPTVMHGAHDAMQH